MDNVIVFPRAEVQSKAKRRKIGGATLFMQIRSTALIAHISVKPRTQTGSDRRASDR